MSRRPVNDPSASQFGHSDRVGLRVYAKKSSDHPLVPSEVIRQGKAISRKWHEYLEGSNTKRPYLRATAVEGVGPQSPVHVPQSLPIVAPTSAMTQIVIPMEPVSVIPWTAIGRPPITLEQARKSVALLESVTQARVFKSPEQQMAADVILHSTQSVLVVLATGGGKSMLIWLAAEKCRSNGVVLVVVPFTALRDDMARHAKQLGFQVCVEASQYHNQDIIILVTDAALENVGLGLIRTLGYSGKLVRIFIDEAHCYVTDVKWRSVFRRFNSFHVGVPLALLTATAPKWVETEINTVLFQAGRPILIKASTNRPNLKFHVRANSRKEDVANELRAQMVNWSAEDRGIVFFRSKASLETFNVLVPTAACHHGDRTVQENAAAVENWINGASPLMIATSGFGLGVNYPKVKLVFFVDLPYSMEDFVQQAGRAGRDGSEAKVVLCWNPHQGLSVEHESDSYKTLVEFAQSKDCRRAIISWWMDGKLEQCSYSANNVACDNCFKYSIEPTSTRTTLLQQSRPPSLVSSEAAPGSSLPAEVAPVPASKPPVEKIMRAILTQESKIASDQENERIALVDATKKMREKLTGCPICFCRKLEYTGHVFNDCQEVKQTLQACFRCIGPHQAKKCTFKKAHIENHCFKCFFPSHPNCYCPGDWPLPFAMYIFRFKRALLPREASGLNLEQFGVWLFQFHKNGLLNVTDIMLNKYSFFIESRYNK